MEGRERGMRGKVCDDALKRSKTKKQSPRVWILNQELHSLEFSTDELSK